MSAESRNRELLRLTAGITAAQVSRTRVSANNLPGLIRAVYTALSSIGSGLLPADKPQPAVPVKQSVFPGYIICLEDGQKMQMLKRHLRTSYGLTPAAYRQRWGLPHNYPMVAADYAAARSAGAKSSGLGRTPAHWSYPVQHAPEGKQSWEATGWDEAAD